MILMFTINEGDTYFGVWKNFNNYFNWTFYLVSFRIGLQILLQTFGETILKLKGDIQK